MRRPDLAQLRRAVTMLVGAFALLLAGSGGGAQASDAGSIVRSAGDVTATLSWSAAEDGVADPALSIARAGATYPVTISDVCLEGCILVADAPGDLPGTSMLKVADLDADGEPEILLDSFSGGAHCCLTTRVLTFSGSGYASTDVSWGDVSYVLKDADGDGRPELVGEDPLFSAAFTAYAGSAFPVEVLRVTKGVTRDVTRRFPGLVAAQAFRLRRSLRAAAHDDDVRGVLAAYVADEYLLGHGPTGLAEIARQQRAKRIKKSFRALLLTQLHRWGYR